MVASRSISFRITDAQHEELRTAAFERRTSIQKVLVERVFGVLTEGGEATDVGTDSVVAISPGAPPSVSTPSSTLASSDAGKSGAESSRAGLATARTARPRKVVDEGFKPDPKPSKR